jgi:hypothetical protein
MMVAATADAAAVRESAVQPLAAPHSHQELTEPGPRRPDLAVGADAGRDPATDASPEVGFTPGSDASSTALFSVYPVPGNIGRDVVIPYYVDLDPSDRRLDFNCGRSTFNDHRGHDPYVRSFSEQRIGVPVFAVSDGIVELVRSGHPDENTDPESTTAVANYVVIRHTAGITTEYVHLRRDVMVKVGDVVTAGTQVGWVGSSGASGAPHIHFEARVGNVPFEPMAGPCRSGSSYFVEQHTIAPREPTLYGATLSSSSFANFRPAPYDDAPHTGTFVRGPQRIFFKAELAHTRAETRYRLLLERPSGAPLETAAVGTLVSHDASLISMWWGLDVDLNVTGQWNLLLEIDGQRIYTMPFTVVGSSSQIVNRAPHPISVALEPVGLPANRAAVCRVTTPFVADPDYDVVRYRYEWRVDTTVVRDVTTAAQADVLAREFVRGGANLTCTVRASDGTLAAQPVSAFTRPPGPTRRRAVRH